MMKRLSRCVFVLSLFLILFNGCSEPLSSDTVKQFQDALTVFNQAQKPEDYLKSAEIYESLIKQGVRSGAIYYNLGNAYAMSEEKPKALAAYRQAVSYMPSNAHLLDNIKSVGGKDKNIPLFENLFFWQNWISFPAKAIIATSFSVLFCVSGILLVLLRNKRMFFVSLILFLLTVCAFVSVQYDYNRFVLTQHGVIDQPNVIARKGDANTYAEAFTQPLTEGVEFTVLQHRSNWLFIQLDDSHEGWVPANSAIVY